MSVSSEGIVDFRGYRTWYRVSGEPGTGTLPLLCLHGGPGSSHAYFAELERLEGRQVVVYDQLGCGDSDRPDDVAWSVQLFVDEVGAVREALGSSGSTCSASRGAACLRSSTRSASRRASSR